MGLSLSASHTQAHTHLLTIWSSEEDTPPPSSAHLQRRTCNATQLARPRPLFLVRLQWAMPTPGNLLVAPLLVPFSLSKPGSLCLDLWFSPTLLRVIISWEAFKNHDAQTTRERESIHFLSPSLDLWERTSGGGRIEELLGSLQQASRFPNLLCFHAYSPDLIMTPHRSPPEISVCPPSIFLLTCSGTHM